MVDIAAWWVGDVCIHIDEICGAEQIYHGLYTA